MFNYWKKIDSLNHMNRLLLAFASVMTVLVLSLLLVITLLPKRFEFWLTPAMMTNGGLVKANEVSPEYVQGFVATLLPTLNTWSKAGKNEFAHNLSAFHYYLTPHHKMLLEQSEKAYTDAQLFNRVQVASLYRFMEEGDVKRLSNTAWEVHLLLRVTQRLSNENPLVIADKVVDYHVRVVKINLSRLENPFQLALDGYTQPEILVRDLLAPTTEVHHASL